MSEEAIRARRRLRVGYVVKRYPRLSETFVLQEILEHERQGTRVHILSLKKPDEGRFHADLAAVRARVTYLGGGVFSRRARVLRASLRVLRSRPRAYLRALVLAARSGDRHRVRTFLKAGEAAEVVESRNLEHLHAHFATGSTTLVMLVSALTGVPYSFTAHARDLFGDHVDRAALRRKVANAAFAVTVSRPTQDYLRSLVGERDRFRVLMIHNGVRPDLLRGAAPPFPRRGLPLVLGIGRLVPKKGFPILIEAAARLHASGCRFRIAILGHGPEHETLLAQARARGLPVRFLGACPHHRTLRILSRARVLVLPCVVAGDRDRDVLPSVLLEAQSLGKPVVTTRVGGIEDIVADGEGGLLVESGDAGALAEAIRFLLRSPREAEAMGRAGRRRMAADFDIRRSVRQLRWHFAVAAGRNPSTVTGVPPEPWEAECAPPGARAPGRVAPDRPPREPARIAVDPAPGLPPREGAR